MLKLFKIEIRRGIINLRFLLVIILGFLICYYGLTDYMSFGTHRIENYRNAYQAWFNALGNGTKAFYILLAPLFCTLPYADSFFYDKNSGYLRNIIHRISYKKIIFSKIIANGIVSGLTIFITLGVFFIYCCILYPAKLPNVPFTSWNFFPQGMFSNVFLTYPTLYILINLVQAFIFGFIFSTFGLAFSFIVTRKQLIFIIPEVLYIVMNLIREFFEILRFSSVQLLFPWKSGSTNIFIVTIEFVIILAISLIIIYKGKDEVY